MAKTRREIILDTISDSITDLFYYDRKEDEDLPRGAIEKAVRNGEITVDEIVTAWTEGVEEALKERK